MSWNYEGILIHLTQTLGGVIGAILIFAYLFYLGALVAKVIKYSQKKSAKKVAATFKWQLARASIIGVVLVAVLSTIGAYRPRITATQGALPVNDSMTVQKLPPVKSSQTYRDSLVEGVEKTDAQTDKTWNSTD